MLPVYAWPIAPAANRLAAFLQQHPQPKHLVFGLPDRKLPNWHAPHAPADTLAYTLHHALRCIQFSGCNYLPQLLDGCDVWLLPETELAKLSDYFGDAPVYWQHQDIPQQPHASAKPWLIPPQPQPVNGRVLVIGAGIAGATTAYELARRGIKVSVLEAANRPAAAASGNRQGLLYAKISAHHTAQTELLLSGYGYTHRLLCQLLPERQTWKDCGVLHLNHDAAESKRNRELAAQTWHWHLYYGVDAAQAEALAGITIEQDGLFWPQGAWLNPAALINALLSHPNIDTHYQTDIQNCRYADGQWTASTENTVFSGSHIVFCSGADSHRIDWLKPFPLTVIRGQTSLAAAVSGSLKLKTALSGASYISPAWQNIHCFGATFAPNDSSSEWRAADETANHQALAQLNRTLAAELAPSLSGSLKGHAAVRCDSFDHLPVVGALGDAAAMRQTYAKLAHDKNYRLNAPCPYLPNAYINTAHGSRGLATAPICAAQLAAEICGDAAVLSARLRQALHPNRLIVRQIVRGITD